MKLHLLSCHEILEYDLLKMFTEMGIDVFSNGAYLEPQGHYLLKRPGVPAAKSFPDYAKLAREFPRNELPKELIEPFDVLFFMHNFQILIELWPRIRHKKVIFYSIGQSNQGVEEALAPLRADGLKIVRMSPKEVNIPRYIGADAIIRFPKDPEDWKDWNGHDKHVINFTQSLMGRRNDCHYDHIIQMMAGFTGKIYGSGNEDLGSLNGGDLPYELMKGKLRDSRVFVYGGTWPAPYSLAFMEAFMTGIPIVAIGKRLAEELQGHPFLDFYEVSDIIQDGVNGFVSDDMSTLRSHVQQLLHDDALAQQISIRGRETALHLFNKETIKEEWRAFFTSI